MPADYRRILGLIETEAHSDVIRGLLRRYPDTLIFEWLAELEELDLLSSVPTEAKHDLDFTGTLRLPALLAEDKKRLVQQAKAAEARTVVAAAKYPPIGERGLSGALPHLQFRSFPAAEALPALNDATMVIVQFESAASLAAMEEIAAVEGVDMVLIGTNDLMADLGIPGQYDHPKVRDAYERTIAACRKHGKHVGVGGFGSRPDLIEQYVRLGGRYVSTGTDLAFLMAACTQRAKQVRDIKP